MANSIEGIQEITASVMSDIGRRCTLEQVREIFVASEIREMFSLQELFYLHGRDDVARVFGMDGIADIYGMQKVMMYFGSEGGNWARYLIERRSVENRRPSREELTELMDKRSKYMSGLADIVVGRLNGLENQTPNA